MVRSLSSAAAHEHASARKRQTSSAQTTDRGPATEALHRPEPQKSVRRLLEGIKITWGLVLGGPVRRASSQDSAIPAGPIESRCRGGGFSSSTWYSAHANRPSEIVLEEKPLARWSPNYDFRKSEVNPLDLLEFTLLYPSFSRAASGQFQPEQPWDGGSSGGFNPLYHIDRPRSIRLALKVQY